MIKVICYKQRKKGVKMSIITKTKEKIELNKKRSKARRTNAKLYPIYKIFAWDLLCYYSIEYLFLTITKGITPSQVLLVAAVYTIAKVILQIPAVIISEYLGKKKSSMLGNLLVLSSILLLIFAPNFFIICISEFISALGWDIKAICDSNLLYDSVATKGGDGLYTKLETKGGIGYYIFDATLSIMAGYFFVVNNYIPMIICALCTLIAFIIACNFKDIYTVKKEERKSIGNFIKEYKTDIVLSLKFIKKSKRIKAYILFGSLFYAILRIMDTYKSNLLTDSGVQPEQYSMIIAILSLIAAVSVGFAKKIQDKFKNKTLTFISMTYLLSWVAIGAISLTIANNVAIPFILMLYVVNRVCDSQWYIVKGKYLKNFTKPDSREKITFTFELVTSLAGGLAALLGAAILEITDIRHAIVLVSLGSLALMIIVLDYMRSRFGLKPKQYTKEDIKF